MPADYTLRLSPGEAARSEDVSLALQREYGVTAPGASLRIIGRSIDARHQSVAVNLTVRVYAPGEPLPALPYIPTTYRPLPERAPQAIIVGAGPCGLFAALRLIELGVRPIIVERGKAVHERRKDVAALSRKGHVDPDSNACFGEGGAGAFSDGKLYTRSKKRGNVERILAILCQHGASTDILVDAHPHIGTDRLPAVVEALRGTILRCGGQVLFSTRMERLLIRNAQVIGIHALSTAPGGEEIDLQGPVILAIGHSARDTYRRLHEQGVLMQPKGLAVGVRLEHPAVLIDRIQYHRPQGKGSDLPTAEYSLVANIDGRGTYSFCMCPGGTVVPVATAPGQVAVNGMSNARRNSPWSNAGIVVEIRPEDLAQNPWRDYIGHCPTLTSDCLTGNAPLNNFSYLIPHSSSPCADPFPLMRLQERLEHETWLAAGRTQAAPAQRMTDFVGRRISPSLPTTSYAPGLVSAPLHFLLPTPVSQRLATAFQRWGRQMHGFLTREATLLAVESRTSSPVRIPRASDTLCQIPGLYPAGEGAGYAGGIVSAAIDGQRCAEALAQALLRGEG